MEPEKKFLVGLVMFVLFLCAFSFVGALFMPATSPPAEPISNADIQTGATVIGWVLLACFAIWIIVKIGKSGFGIPIFFALVGIALILFITGNFVYSDKNNDGVSDVMIVRVVQPSGDNAFSDSVYSEVNQNNAKANISNAASLSIYAAVILIVVIVFFFGGIILHYLKK